MGLWKTKLSQFRWATQAGQFDLKTGPKTGQFDLNIRAV